MMKPTPSTPIRIKDILQTTQAAILVQLPDGRVEWLPRRYAEFYPGHVIIPQWLSKKLSDKSP
jgi:hypothetical protein